MAELRFAHAINRALAECMEEDPMVFLFGEDIAEAGGPFGVTRGLHDRFGSDRIRDTPISEATMANAAVGAALSGLKPVLEIMFMDFMTLTMDALVNQAAKARFMFGGQASVPMVVRTPHGGGISAGPQHSQCLEAWFAHIPGLKVVCPSNPADAYGLLKSAVRDPDPVVFVENKALYAAKGEVPDDAGPIPLGQARIARAGRDLTVVSYGAMVHKVERAAEALARDGIEAEVLDLRSIQPWDEAAARLGEQQAAGLADRRGRAGLHVRLLRRARRRPEPQCHQLQLPDPGHPA
ncbi:putative TPP-dependent acetoin dehydrogenase complex, E1 component, beta subunit, partial [Bordetella bronchiseptica E014]